jgi:hypothetical protein
MDNLTQGNDALKQEVDMIIEKLYSSWLVDKDV